MTDPASTVTAGFWQTKRLDEMTDAEWDSLCDGCGRCCLEKLEADDTHKLYPLDVACALLDPATGGCSDYANRQARIPGCVKLTAANIRQSYWLPPTCAYKRLDSGQALAWWHPLVSGNADSVRAAGISVAGRCIKPHLAGAGAYHIVDWPLRDDGDPSQQVHKAMFGGVNASVPTPFADDLQVDLDLMATHCFWLLANGCQGLVILDDTGEVAALSIPERMRVMQGLIGRGLPASKLLVGISPGSVLDQQRIARLAGDLGIRGLLLKINAAARSLPATILPQSVHGLIQATDPAVHLYLSFAAAGAAAAGLTAIDALLSQYPERLRGIRDETRFCAFGKSVLQRFPNSRLEVYGCDPANLLDLVKAGGAGLIGPAANLVSRASAQLLAATDPQQIARMQRFVTAVGAVLRARPVVPTVKTLLARQTGQPAWTRMRLPLRPLRPAGRAALFAAFDACDPQIHPPSPG